MQRGSFFITVIIWYFTDHDEFKGAGFPQGQSRVVANPGIPDKRTDLLRVSYRAESDLHGALHPQRVDADDRDLSVDALGDHSAAVRQRALDDAAGNWALPRHGWRLEGGGMGVGVDTLGDARVLPLREGGRTATAQGRSGKRIPGIALEAQRYRKGHIVRFVRRAMSPRVGTPVRTPSKPAYGGASSARPISCEDRPIQGFAEPILLASMWLRQAYS